MQSIKQQVRVYLLDNFIMGGNADDLKEGDSFMERHIMDSTGFIELITFVEQSFGIRIEDEEMIPENLDSLDNIEQFVSRKRGGAAANK